MQTIYIISEVHVDPDHGRDRYLCVIAINKKAFAATSRIKVKLRNNEATNPKYPLSYEILINPDESLLKIPQPVYKKNFFQEGLCTFHWVLNKYPEYTQNKFDSYKGKKVTITSDGITITHRDERKGLVFTTPDIDFAFLNEIFSR